MLQNIPDGEDETNIVPYMEYIDSMHPRKNEDGSANPDVVEVRHNLMMNFAKPGGAGAKFKNTNEKMLKALTLPKGAREDLGIDEFGNFPSGDADDLNPVVNEDEEEDPAKVAEMTRIKADRKLNEALFAQSRYHMIPSFFRMMMYMKKQKREFAVVFNSFGEDLDNTVAEWNKFCEGDHPCYNGRSGGAHIKFDGSKHSKDLRIRQPEQRTTLYRTGDAIN